jgi:hypothetical protein
VLRSKGDGEKHKKTEHIKEEGYKPVRKAYIQDYMEAYAIAMCV